MEKLVTVRLSDDERAIVILDQTKLPGNIEYITLDTPELVFEAIKSLRVRGAPAIGVAAALAMYALAHSIPADDFLTDFERLGDYLISSRPTAVNLPHAVERMKSCAERYAGKADILQRLREEAIAIRDEDIAMCKAISEYGLSLVKQGDGILTHCNAGALAAVEYGTGLGALLLGTERGMDFKCYVDETRPLMQGARLTALELSRAGLDVTLICDSAASLLMKQGKISACFVGCDRVAANGDTANKIGTRSVAVNAHYHNIPLYVFCPSSTVDFSCRCGADIVIEERSGNEIAEGYFSRRIAPEEVKCLNPAFDVTDAELISAIVTEKGICRYPYTESLKILKK
ncbi:MAG: S-methyl-5-thioribose-1-phosphate isomerase [Oscillospiraceae bacterium]